MTNQVVGAVLRHTNHAWWTGANLPAHTLRAATIPRRDPYSGSYRITELVYYNGDLARRRVKLFVREGRGFRCIRETWSDAVTGRYTFNGIAPGKYLVLADDFLAQKNAVVADLIDAEPMP